MTLVSRKIREAVRDRYKKAVTESDNCASGCCGGPKEMTNEQQAALLGYSSEDLTTLPEGANLGLGCGSPVADAGIKEGDTVVDLGSGGGIDCFLASKLVGPHGKVIGVDMTPEMLSKARELAEKSGTANTEFRLGEIEHLPVADGTADVIISNCVVNLSPEKDKVFSECFRILKPGGRIFISDVVALDELPEDIKKNMEQYTGCISGASTVEQVKTMLTDCGFGSLSIRQKGNSSDIISSWTPDERAPAYAVSAYIQAVKP